MANYPSVEKAIAEINIIKNLVMDTANAHNGYVSVVNSCKVDVTIPDASAIVESCGLEISSCISAVISPVLEAVESLKIDPEYIDDYFYEENVVSNVAAMREDKVALIASLEAISYTSDMILSHIYEN